jgi:hypothetical protein
LVGGVRSWLTAAGDGFVGVIISARCRTCPHRFAHAYLLAKKAFRM